MEAARRYSIEKVGISRVNLEKASRFLVERAKAEERGYVCVANVRSVYRANKEQEFCRILQESLMTVPDGKPLEWYARVAGYSDVEKTSGPDLFREILKESVGNGFSHFLYGSTTLVIERMIEKLRRSFHGLNIVEAYAPPFADAKTLARSEVVARINATRPDFVWVGLGAPKQERFMHEISTRIDKGILVGIGLAFEYEAKTVRRAPRWMQESGLEWMIRFLQQPLYSKRSLPAFAWFLSRMCVNVLRRNNR